MKRKNGTLYTLLIIFVAYALLTWFFPVTTYSTEFVDQGNVKMGLTELLSYPTYTFYNFIYIFMYLLMVGGLYGILKHIKAYRKLVDKIVERVKEKEWFYIILTTVILSTIVAFTGFTYELLVVMPFIATIVLLSGRDKVTAALMTLGPIAVGVIANLYSTIIVGTFVNSLGIAFKDLIVPKIILLVLGMVTIVGAIILHNRKHANDEIDSEFAFIPEEVPSNEKVKVWPLATILGIFAFVMVLASIAWQGTFNVAFFTKLKEKVDAYPLFSKLITFLVFGLIIIGLLVKYIKAKKKDSKTTFVKTIGKVGLVVFIISAVILTETTLKVLLEDAFEVTKVFSNLGNTLGLNSVTVGNLLGNTAAIGAWTYSELIMWLAILCIVLMIKYRIKLSEFIDNSVKGMKTVLYAVLICMLSYTILVSTSNNPVMLTILKPVINLIGTTTVPVIRLFLYVFNSLISAFLNSDFGYFSYSVFNTSYASNTLGQNVLPLVGLIHQGTIGVALLVAPTSIPMLFTLNTLNLSYKEWWKRVWLLFLILLYLLLMMGIIVLLFTK